ncbi:hypothetical protein DLAC_02021 [Tieghemostelium lacteum]|uniref:CDP-diacylglycerol--inositol 3-phosphatidyltransferase n=1 Tax=Tieghemostelium lacteum TaxID=361077 RepID=A0A152A5D9_TIELA|nr:hypothetical protein DLAC_02021 [Tieghemostelium lacteum]|eukprot:KYR01301.1 hypothetical protein DLAC_02021 [Tieghemostelium lacteum]
MADGHAARYFNQCSQLGGMLDMLTDRASTVALMILLSNFYSDYLYWFMGLIVLDIVSHFARISANLMTGKLSHKMTESKHHWLLNIYYENKYFLALLCGMNEGFFLFTYLSHFIQLPIISFVQWYILFPGSFLKQSISVLQFYQSLQDIVDFDESKMKSIN